MITEIIGVDVTIDAIGTSIKDFSDRVNSIIQYAGQEAEGIAYDLAAVDTGLMRASIAYTPGDLYAEVHDYVYYSVFVNFGTSRQKAQPFMTPAYDEAKAHMLENIQTL